MQCRSEMRIAVSIVVGIAALAAARARAQPVPDPPPWRCNGFVHGFARDMEHGTFVPLDAAHFDLVAENVTVLPHDDGFMVSSERARTVEYVIVDRVTRRSVSRGDVALECPPPPTPTPRATPTSASGIHVHRRDAGHEAAHILEFLGFGVVGASVLAIVGVTLFSILFEPQPVYYGGGISIGIGALVGITGVIVDATAESRSTRAATALTLRF